MNQQVELIRVPEVETGDLEWAGLDIVTKAEEVPAVILDDQTYEACAKVIIEAKVIVKKIAERIGPEKQRRHEAHRMVCDLETALNAFPKRALEIAEPKRLVYEKEAEDKVLAEAQYLQEMGEPEAAEQVLSQPIESPPVILGRAVPKVKGLRVTMPVWAGQIFDLMAVVQAVASKALPLAAILGIEPLDGHRGIYQSQFWNQQAKNLMRTQESYEIGPGVKAYDKNDMAV